MSDNETAPTNSRGETQKAEDKHVKLKIGGTGFPDLMIRVKRTTKLRRMMKAYCDRAGKTLDDVRFIFDGDRLSADQTVQDLELDEDEDELAIEVVSFTIGG